MKVRIGISLGPAGAPEAFAGAVDRLEQSGVDSLWLPENVYSPLVEPFTGMAFALSRTRRLKAGSGISVLPGRHPVLVAKQLASLAGLAPGRVLPVFGLQPAQPAERAVLPPLPPCSCCSPAARGLQAGARGPQPLDIWLGVRPRRARRWAAGRRGSARCAAAVGVIQAAAAEAGREVDPATTSGSASR